MWSILVILFIGITIPLFEVLPLIRKRMWRETISFFTLHLLGLTFFTLLLKNIFIPSPLEWLIKIFSPMTELIDYLLS